MARRNLGPHAPASQWAKVGLVAGLVAGLVFAMFEMIVAAAMGASFWGPLRMISGIVLGAEAVEPTYPLGTAIVVGLVVHMILSGLYGAVWGYIDSGIRAVQRNRTALVASASLFGLVLWLVNFYIFAPALFPWFTQANPVVQFIAHTFFFGMVLGLLVAARQEPVEEEAVVRPQEPVQP